MTDFQELRKRLVERLISEGYLRSKSCINAFLKVPREKFVWRGFERDAYIDTPLPLGDTGQTISAPHMCAYLLEELELEIGYNVLEIGAGSGYQAALIAECVAPTNIDKHLWGHVTTVEINSKLVEFAISNLKKTGYEERVTVIHGDGSLGYPPLLKEEIYDRIVVTAESPSIPETLIMQLKKGGLMLIPVGSDYFQDLIKVIK
ncbi:TPA: protein-L-isoaspartate O-methyltransferase, partial [Candidatus Geothermarchaeota archaeon]|nr:protein-L-isoaspartate O-methyltransferase [Candidatus Geothermarchaeota archaeon]